MERTSGINKASQQSLRSSKFSSRARLTSDYPKDYKSPAQRLNPLQIKDLKTEYRKFSNKMEIMTRKAFLQYFNLEQIEGSTIAERLYVSFSKQGSIDFSKFLTSVGVLAKGTLDERIEFLFKIFDVNQGGVVERRDFKRLLMSILESVLEIQMDDSLNLLQEEVAAMSPQDREEAVDAIIDEIPLNRSNVVTFQEFYEYVTGSPLLRRVLETQQITNSDEFDGLRDYFSVMYIRFN